MQHRQITSAASGRARYQRRRSGQCFGGPASRRKVARLPWLIAQVSGCGLAGRLYSNYEMRQRQLVLCRVGERAKAKKHGDAQRTLGGGPAKPGAAAPGNSLALAIWHLLWVGTFFFPFFFGLGSSCWAWSLGRAGKGQNATDDRHGGGVRMHGVPLVGATICMHNGHKRCSQASG